MFARRQERCDATVSHQNASDQNDQISPDGNLSIFKYGRHGDDVFSAAGSYCSQTRTHASIGASQSSVDHVTCVCEHCDVSVLWWTDALSRINHAPFLLRCIQPNLRVTGLTFWPSYHYDLVHLTPAGFRRAAPTEEWWPSGVAVPCWLYV